MEEEGEGHVTANNGCNANSAVSTTDSDLMA
jgi:hypothetical protein